MKTENLTRRLLSFFMALFLVVGCAMPALAASGVQINKTSATIAIGETYQLKVTVDGKAASASWGSGNTSVATVDSKTGKVTGKAAGSAVITGMVNGTSVECLISVVKQSANTTYRYNVLILDASGSMKGNPNSAQKLAAKRFCKKVLSTKGANYVAVVSLGSSSRKLCGFSDNYNTLAKYIDSIGSSGNTNMNQALSLAGSLLDSVGKSGSNVMKNVVLCSDGLPTTGSAASAGKYTSSVHRMYRFANSAYSTASAIKKKGYFIYALGFFHNSAGNDLIFGKRLMKDLASKDKYYVIQDSGDLDEVFDQIANQITKTTINKSSLTLKVGATYQLNALVNGVKKSASWKSSNSSVATVNSSGKVTAKKAGTATITATLNGKKVTCKVTVKSVVKVKLNRSSYTMYVGEKLKLKATVTGSKKTVTWKSSNTSVATVSSSGVVTAKKAGKATISATVAGVTAKCVVTVKTPSHPIYSFYYKFPATKYSNTGATMNETGLRIVLGNSDAIVLKCGVYVKKSGNYWYSTMAFKGQNVKSATLSGYISYNGKVLEDGMTSRYLNTFTMRQDSSGVWSMGGNYGGIKENIKDDKGNIVVDVTAKKQGSNVKFFSDLSEMKKWLQS